MEHVYGPVPSRRLGQSLGIDPIPLKTCNWNCVYCQLGRTRPLTNERINYVPVRVILAEIQNALDCHAQGGIDWITIVGSGEPTLHAGIGHLIQEVKMLTDLPIAVITNGSLFYLPEVRKAVLPADAVLPSLDAGSANLYRLINRPHPDIPFERFRDGLVKFRREFSGKLWVEVMLIKGLNDTEVALREIAAALGRIRPDEIHINLPTRPPVEAWVQPADDEGLVRALAILGDLAHVVCPVEGGFDLSGEADIVDAIIEIAQRHPMRQEEIEQTLAHWTSGEVDETLAALEASGKLQVVERMGTRFWSSAKSYYPHKSDSRRASPVGAKHSQPG